MFKPKSSDRQPHLAPLTINKRAGPDARAREHSTASITSNPPLSPNGSLSSTNTYSESASAASVAAGFIAEVDSWIMDICQQLNELEERHAVHREWLANRGASDAESESNEENDIPSENTSATSGSFFPSLFSRSTAGPAAALGN